MLANANFPVTTAVSCHFLTGSAQMAPIACADLPTFFSY